MNKDSAPTRIITKYCQQHGQIKGILLKCWHLLSMDTTLVSFVSTQPLITYRKASSLRDKLVCSEYKITKQHSTKPVGAFRCGNCNYCQYMNIGKYKDLPNGQKFKPRHFVNCRTVGIVYLLQCECNCYYVGKTKLEFWQRIYRHIVSIKKRDPSLPLGRHCHTVQHDSTPKVRFLALDHIPNNPRGGKI